MKRLLCLFLITTGVHSMSFGWDICNPIKRWFTSSTTNTPIEDSEERMKTIRKELDHSNDEMNDGINDDQNHPSSVSTIRRQIPAQIYIKTSFRKMKQRWPVQKKNRRSVKNSNH